MHRLSNWIVTLTVAFVLGFSPLAAQADWADNFTGGLNQPWVFFDDGGNAPPDATDLSTASNDVRMTGNVAQASIGNFDSFVAGLVGFGNPAFGFTDVQARVNTFRIQGNTFTLASAPGNNDAFVLIRSNGASGYLLALDMQSGDVDLVRSDNGVVAGLGASAADNIAGFDPTKVYTLEITAIGTALSGRVLDGLTEVASVSATDGTYASGWSGFGAAINDNAAINRTFIASGFDNASSVVIPLPAAAWAGLALLGAYGALRRRS